MTTIVIEDGSVVAGANSYVSMAEYIAYAATLNITVTDSQVFQTQIIEAGQFIDGLENQDSANGLSQKQFNGYS